MSDPSETRPPGGWPTYLDMFCGRDLSTVTEEWQQKADAELAALRARCEKFETALREIVAGKMPCDFAAGEKNAGDLCAGRLCEIARRALEATNG